MNHLIALLICLGITRTRALPTLHDGFHVAHQQAPPSLCPKGYFDCGFGELRSQCIPHYWVCDNIHDCTTGADELACGPMHPCDIGHFKCPNSDCYLAHQRCDGVKNCLDGYDELACAITPELHQVFGPVNSKLPQGISTTNDHITEDQQKLKAEPIVDSQEEGSRVHSLMLVFSIILFVVLALFITRWALQRYPSTAYRVDHTLKEFNRNVIQPRLMQRSSPSRVNITSPQNNEHYFENPMMNIVQEPLMVNVGNSPVAATNASASTSAFSPNNQRQ